MINCFKNPKIESKLKFSANTSGLVFINVVSVLVPGLGSIDHFLG